MYPNLTLEVQDGIINFVYNPSADSFKKITLNDEDLTEVITNIAQRLNISDLNEPIELKELLTIAREADELYITEYPEIDLSSIELNLEDAINKFFKENEIEREYEDLDLDDDTRNEIIKNQNADYFASILDYLYMHIISKIVVAASELGIGTIRLSDDTKNTRLQEKMAMELDKIGAELVID